MNTRDRTRLATIRQHADVLLSGPKSVNAQITNMDVMEALLGDIACAQNDRDPKFLAELIRLDAR